MPDKTSTSNFPKFDRTTGLNAGSINETDERDPATVAALEAALAPRETNVVGNFADVQRGGGFVATGQSDSMADGVLAGVDRIAPSVADPSVLVDGPDAKVAESSKKDK